jgi:hypothetical protein
MHTKRRMSIASLIKEKLGKTSVTDYTYCINKAILFFGSTDNDTREEVLDSLNEQSKRSVDSSPYRPAKMHFPVEFPVISNI